MEKVLHAHSSDDTEVCPMCVSKFDRRKFKLMTCSVCGGEGSTACCMPEQVNGDLVCFDCEDDS